MGTGINGVSQESYQRVEKSACGVLFRGLAQFPSQPYGPPGGKQRKETLLRKVSESAAQVTGLGLHLEDCVPPNHPEGFLIA